MCRKKETESIGKIAMEIFGKVGTLKTQITDENCEFISQKLKQICQQNKIAYHKTPLDKHQNNGRAE